MICRRLKPIVLSVLLAAFAFSASSETELSKARLTTESIAMIYRYYIDPERIDALRMLEGAFERISGLLPEALLTLDENEADVTIGIAHRRFPLGKKIDQDALTKVLRNILEFVDQHYSGTVERPEIEYAAIDGMLSALDPHSSFFPPEAFTEFQVNTRGVFGGLGIVISIRDGFLTVIAPLANTPAAAVGIRTQDRILQIDQESTSNMSLTDAVDRLRGDIGSTVSLVVERRGRPEPFTVTLTRALINIESVRHVMLTEGTKRIGYLQVKNFQSNTVSDVKEALAKMKGEKNTLDGLILDLRNNPGGLLDQSVALTDLFLSDGAIVSTQGPRGKLLEKEEATALFTEPPYPMAVLINEGSASASEIVAGALQVHHRAVILGNNSFGKGSVQTIYEVGKQAAIKLTVAQYLAGGKQAIQLRGVIPDIELLPSVVDREVPNLVKDTFPTENDLEQHLEEKKSAEGTSLFTLKHLAPKEEEDQDVQSAKSYAERPDLSGDFAVMFAKEILVEGKDMIAVSRAVAAREEAKISTALVPLGVVWSAPSAAGKPALTLTSTLLKKGKPVKSIPAGETAEIELVANNGGDGHFVQLVGATTSDASFLQNKEFLFGTLPQGTTKSWKSTITIPEAIPTQELVMTVEFHEAHGNTPTPVDVVIPVEGKPTPHFAFSYRLLEAAGHQQINTGGVLHLSLDVSNVGKGSTSDETFATLTNKAGNQIFLKKGRATLGKIAPQGTATASFEFRIDPAFSERDASFELAIIDPKRMISITQDLEVKVVNGHMEPVAGKRYQPPIVEITTPSSTTRHERIELTGTVRDDGSVRDYIVYVGGKKFSYTPSVHGNTALPFSLQVPLKPGNNLIIVAARDEENLLGRQALVIKYAPVITEPHNSTTSL